MFTEQVLVVDKLAKNCRINRRILIYHALTSMIFLNLYVQELLYAYLSIHKWIKRHGDIARRRGFSVSIGRWLLLISGTLWPLLPRGDWLS